MDEAEINPFAVDYGFTPSTSRPMIKTPSTVPSFTTSAGTTAYGGGSVFTNDWNDDQKLVQAMAAPAAAAAPLPKTVELKTTTRTSDSEPRGGADSSALVAQLRSELRSKDATIAALQDEVQRLQRTTQKANWPRFLPLLYMDIEAEVREPVRKRHVKFTYYYWMYVVACYFVNFFLMIVAYWSGALAEIFTDGYVPFMWQIIIILLAPPLSFLAWVKTLYNAARIDSSAPSSKYWIFFLNFFVHFCVAVLCMAGVFFQNGGIIISKRFFDAVRRLDSWGIAFIVSVIFWAIAVLIALYLLITIGLWYRRQGGSRPKTTDFYKRRTVAGNSAYDDGDDDVQPESRPFTS